jgi:conserved oligomeric Golgi complex subunit 5
VSFSIHYNHRTLHFLLLLVALLDSPISQNISQDGRGHAEANFGDENTRRTDLAVSLRSINAVAAHVRFIEEARTTVTNEMENMVMTGLATLVRNLLFNLTC